MQTTERCIPVGFKVVATDVDSGVQRTLALFDYRSQAISYATDCSLYSQRCVYTVTRSYPAHIYA